MDKSKIEAKLAGLKTQLDQAIANANYLTGSIKVLEELLIEGALVAEAVSPVEIGS